MADSRGGGTKPKLTTSHYDEENKRLFAERIALQSDLLVLHGVTEKSLEDASGALRREAISVKVVGLSKIARDELEPEFYARHVRIVRRLDRVTEQIVKLNEKLIHRQVNVWATYASPKAIEDYHSASMLGMLRAIQTFDPTKGKFSSWAFNYMKNQLLKSVRDNEHANLSQGDFEARQKILLARQELSAGQDPNFQPSAAEIAATAGTTLDRTIRVLNAPRMLSIDYAASPSSSDSSLGFADVLTNGELLEDDVIKTMTAAAIHSQSLMVLTDKERFVLTRRFGLDGEPPMHLADIGALLELSREAARNIEARSLAKLAHPATIKHLIQMRLES